MSIGLALVLAAAAIFRIAYALQYRAESIFFRIPILDALIYDEWARRIAAGEWLPPGPFYFAPGYPYLLGLFYRFVSGAREAVYAAQMLLGLLNIVLVHRLAWRSFGRRAALAAAALAALYASFPFLETKLMASTVALTSLLLAMESLAAGAAGAGAASWVMAGLFLGATSVIRPATLVMAPFVAAWMALRGAPLREEGSRGLAWRRFIPAVGLVAAGWALSLAPTALHNAWSGGGSILISSQGGITFYQANNPRARGLYVALSGDGFSGNPVQQAEEEKAIAEESLGRALTRSEVSGYWFGKGLEFIAGQPGRFVWLLGMKLLRFAGSYEYSTEYIIYVERESVWLLRLAFVPFALLLALAIPTLAGALRPGPGGREAREAPWRLNATGWLLLAILAANLAVCLAFYVSSRYRLPAVPPLAIFAGATLARAAGEWRARRRGGIAATAAAVAIIFALTHFEKDVSAHYQEANVHYNTGNILYQEKEYGKAVREFERAAAMDDSRHTIWYNLGNTYRVLERWGDAARAYGMAGERRKKFINAHVREAEMRMKTGEFEAARAAWLRAEALSADRYDVQMGLGRAAAALGGSGEAARRFDRALKIKPGDRDALRERAGL
jgi:tetratricopeptide (TPR) repeat protein